MLISITGPSGVGKGYFQGKIRNAFPHLSELVWLTSRPLRPEERAAAAPNRRSVTREELAAMQAKRLLAHDHEVYGHRYALSFAELARTAHEHCMTEFHIDTLRAIVPLVPKVVAIALVPASRGVIERNLLQFRGAAPSDETTRRIDAAESEAALIRERANQFSLVVEIGESATDHQEHLVISHIGRSLT